MEELSPKLLIEQWVDVFNQGNAKALSEFYAKDVVNHQVADDPVEGRQAIRKRFEKEFSTADMTCIIENIFEDGEWAILEWKDSLGLRGCGFFHIQHGKIQFQRGYWDKLSFMRQHGLPLPSQ